MDKNELVNELLAFKFAIVNKSIQLDDSVENTLLTNCFMAMRFIRKNNLSNEYQEYMAEFEFDLDKIKESINE